MINLPHETEALARQLANAKHLSPEEAIRQALEEKARAEGIVTTAPVRDQSPEAVAARRARTDQFVASLDAMPILDARSPQEIMDDLNSL